MKKFWVLLGIYLAAMVGIAWGNYAVLTHFHPLEYYYTPAGALLNMAVSSVECMIAWPISKWYIVKVLLPSIK